MYVIIFITLVRNIKYLQVVIIVLQKTYHLVPSVITILAILIASYYVFNNLVNRKRKKLQFELLAFQSHTNPHFIKNVLQAINWFILNNDKNKASDYLCDFSRLMEDILIFSKKKFVTLTEKLNFLDLYLKLQHLRHEDKFDYVPLGNNNSTIRVENDINPDVFLLPPLLIHPFIENAIEHGLKSKSEKGFIDIDFSFNNNKLICRITDNGIGIKASKNINKINNTNRSEIGLINTQKRIELIRQIYGIKIEVKMEEHLPENDDPGTKITLAFPMPLSFNPNYGMPVEIYK